LTPEQTYLAALWTGLETLMTGGTTLVDHLILAPGLELETIGAAMQAYEEIGIRAFVAPLVQDHGLAVGIPVGTPSEPLMATAQTPRVLSLLEQAIARYHRPDKGLHIALGPTGFQLCSTTLFKHCIDLSQQYDLCCHTHLLETKAQQMLAYERYGSSAVEYLQSLGFLGAKTSLAHCVWLDDRDISILADTGATVVHNPLSNLRLGSGIAPLLKYRQAGVNVTFGCDGSASNDGQDLLEAIKLGMILHNTTDFEYREWLDTRVVLEMASQGGMTGIGLQDQVGAIAVGRWADLVLYDLNDWSVLPHTDPLGLLFLGRPTGVVAQLWVKGRSLIQDRQPTQVDRGVLRQRLVHAYTDWIRAVPAINPAIETHYRQVMGLGRAER
jgi:guanine deaminase